jgi:LmbE family N-acetylglucosaminyl deacetylase
MRQAMPAPSVSKRPRRRALLLGIVAAAAILAGCSWAARYWAWRQELQAAGFVDEMSPPGSGDRVLVVAPHPDDETLGCGGVIQEAAARGAEVHVVLMTNGDASELAVILGERELRLTPEAFIELGRKRQQESLRALTGLGVPASHIHFLGFPNNGLTALWRPEHWPYSRLYRAPRTRVSLSPYRGAVSPQAPYCGQQVLADLMAVLHQVRPNLIFVTDPQDIHPDHWATCCFLRYALATIAVRGAAWARGAQVYGYLIHWPGYPLPARVAPQLQLLPPPDLIKAGGEWLRLPLPPELSRRKLAAIRGYRTQGPSFDRLLLRFARANETFELLPTPELEIGRAMRFRDEHSHRHGLGGVEMADLRLAVSERLTISAEVRSSPQPIASGAYIAVDVRGWDERGAPVITTVYEESGGIVRAVRLDEETDDRKQETEDQADRQPSVTRQLSTVNRVRARVERGRLWVPRLPLPPQGLAQRELFVTCWGSVRDRATDGVALSPVRLRSADRGDADQ